MVIISQKKASESKLFSFQDGFVSRESNINGR